MPLLSHRLDQAFLLGLLFYLSDDLFHFPRFNLSNYGIADGNRTHNGFPMGISADTSSMPLARRKYSLRSFPRLDKNPLWENCKAPVSEKFLRDFRCEGRSWADAQQGRQGKKIQKEPLSGVASSTLVCYNVIV
jgi:hypothetical protein